MVTNVFRNIPLNLTPAMTPGVSVPKMIIAFPSARSHLDQVKHGLQVEVHFFYKYTGKFTRGDSQKQANLAFFLLMHISTLNQPGGVYFERVCDAEFPTKITRRDSGPIIAQLL